MSDLDLRLANISSGREYCVVHSPAHTGNTHEQNERTFNTAMKSAAIGQFTSNTNGKLTVNSCDYISGYCKIKTSIKKYT